MINIRLAKHKAITKVGKDTSKELQSLINKVTRRSNDRRTLRTRIEDVIATYVIKVLDKNRMESLCYTFQPRAFSDEAVSKNVVSGELSRVIVPFYEGDSLNDDPKLYAEELEAFLTVLVASIDVVAAADCAEVEQLKADTKTVCGYVDGSWDGNNRMVLLAKSDLIELSQIDPNGRKCVNIIVEGTCGEIMKVSEAWKHYYSLERSDKVKSPEERLPHECYWYCKENEKFFTLADVKAKENANKKIRAFVQNHKEDNGFNRW